MRSADSIAILLSIPLQLFPAVRIMENGLFSKSGKHNPAVKWRKNLFRAGTVVCCSIISYLGSKRAGQVCLSRRIFRVVRPVLLQRLVNLRFTRYSARPFSLVEIKE